MNRLKNFLGNYLMRPIMYRTIIFSLFLVLLFACPGWGATCYVKNGGNDSLDGLSDATAWATIAKVQATVRSGDTVYFRSQDTWTSASTSVAILTATAGVTYDGSTYGSGTRAKFQSDTGFTGGVLNAMVKIDVSNVTFQGFELDGNQQNAGGIYVGYTTVSNISNITINNCVVHDQGSPSTSGLYMYGILISARNSITTSNVTLTNCTIHNTYHEGIAIYPSWNAMNNKVDTVLVRNCASYNNGTAPTLNGIGLAINNDSDNVTVEFCSFYGNDYGISVRTSIDPGVAIGAPNNLVVRYNISYLNNGQGIDFMNAFNQTFTGDFYGNLFYNNCFDVSIGAGSWASSILNFYNNTIFNNKCSTAVAVAVFGANILGTPVFNFKNNIVYTNNFIAIYDRHHWLTHSNNLVYRSDSASNTAISDSIYNSTPISSVEVTVSQGTGGNADYMYFTKSGGEDWTKLFIVGDFVKWSGFSSGNLNNALMYIYEVSQNYLKVYYAADSEGGKFTDVNTVNGEKWVTSTYNRSQTNTWELTAKNADPAFTGGTLPKGFSGTYRTDMRPNTSYFMPGAASAAVNNGASLRSPYNGCINGAGLANPITRPQGAACDIGAYEYVESVSETIPPAAPKNLRNQ